MLMRKEVNEMPRLVHFAIPADDPERAAGFYTAVFGWDIKKWNGPLEYWMVSTGPDDRPGINGGLVRRHESLKGAGAAAYVCAVDVPSVDEYAGKIEANGGSIVLPKMAIPGVGWLAYYRDTEGNIFGIIEEDPKAV